MLVSARALDGGVKLVIEDDGNGPDDTEYPQGEPGTTGLGLYLAQCVAEAHAKNGVQGHVELQKSATLGGGAFVLWLP